MVLATWDVLSLGRLARAVVRVDGLVVLRYYQSDGIAPHSHWQWVDSEVGLELCSVGDLVGLCWKWGPSLVVSKLREVSGGFELFLGKQGGCCRTSIQASAC
jgi:hypothetical protein